jgi:hypothetical protein
MTVVVLAAATWAGPGVTAAGAAPSHRLLARTVLDTRLKGPRLPRSFLGFSVEYPQLFTHLGSPSAGPNPIFDRLLANLGRFGDGPVSLRVGGGSTDAAWWNPTGRPNPRGVTYSLTPTTVQMLGDFARRTGSRLLLGLNLAIANPRFAIAWATAAMAGLPQHAIQSFEVGNEPDIYSERPYYRDHSGRVHFTRSRRWNFRTYLAQLGRYVSALRRLDPRPPLAGPSACCQRPWDAGLPALLAREGSRLNLITYHWYALDGCTIKRRHPLHSRGYPAAARRARLALLSPLGLGRPARTFAALARLARRRHLPFRLTETGSAACGGLPSVSDSFASALWSTDWLFLLWLSRLAGVNFHSAGGAQGPFSFVYGRSRRWLGRVRPLYYGLLLFAEATANRPRLLYGPTIRTTGPRKVNLRIWATLDRHRTARLVVLNKDPRASGTIEVRLRGRAGPATVALLRAPSLAATSGIRLAGQRFAVPTDGTLQGTRRVSRPHRRHGVLRFFLPRASAALLTVRDVRR